MSLSLMESTLYKLKEVSADTDAVHLKNEIERYLTQASDGIIDEKAVVEFIKTNVAALSSSFNLRPCIINIKELQKEIVYV